MADISSIAGKTKVDNNTIKYNSNDELEATSEKTIIGDFENDRGAWSSTGVADLLRTADNGGAEGTSQYVYVRTTSTGLGGAERSYDLTNAQTLVAYVRVDPRDGFAGSSGSIWEIQIDGGVVASGTLGSRTSWKKYVIDVSGYTGSTVIRFEVDSDTSSNQHLGFDRVQVLSGVSEILVSESIDSGAGGS